MKRGVRYAVTHRHRFTIMWLLFLFLYNRKILKDKEKQEVKLAAPDDHEPQARKKKHPKTKMLKTETVKEDQVGRVLNGIPGH